MSKSTRSIEHCLSDIRPRRDMDNLFFRAQRNQFERIKTAGKPNQRTVDLAQLRPRRTRLQTQDDLRRVMKETSPPIIYENVPVKLYDQPVSEQRRTRRSTASVRYDVTVNGTSRPQMPPSLTKYSERYGFGSLWKKPLTFPRTGSAKATVVYDDLYRLDEEDYLNDNLISFCLRYAQLKSEQTAKRVHIFNSFFYDTLTKDIAKGQNINYDAVRRWTTKSRLLDNHDYVVVPINQNFHWYAAIICNLQTLIKDPVHEADAGHEQQEQLDEREAEEIPSEIQNGNEPDVPDGVDLEAKDSSPSEPAESTTPKSEVEPSTPSRSTRSGISKQEAPSNVEVDVSFRTPDLQNVIELGNTHCVSDESQPNTPGSMLVEDTARMSISDTKGCKPHVQLLDDAQKLSPEMNSSYSAGPPEKQSQDYEIQAQQVSRKSKKKRPPQPVIRKRDAEEPVIIVLDSLHSTHGTVVRKLKDYVEAEAKDKLSKEILCPLKVANEKSVPGQNNFSDCGIYLVGYISKFLKDPAGFVTKQASGELRADPDWQRLDPSVIRNNIRSIIQNEYKVQKAELKATRDPAEVARSRQHPPRLASAYQEFTEPPPSENSRSRDVVDDKTHEAATLDVLPHSPQREDVSAERREDLQVTSAPRISANNVEPGHILRQLSDQTVPKDDTDELAGSPPESSAQRSPTQNSPAVLDRATRSRTPPPPQEHSIEAPAMQNHLPDLHTCQTPSHFRKSSGQIVTIADSQDGDSPSPKDPEIAAVTSINGQAETAIPSSPLPERSPHIPSPRHRDPQQAFDIDEQESATLVDVDEEIQVVPPSQHKQQSRKRLRTPEPLTHQTSNAPGRPHPARKQKMLDAPDPTNRPKTRRREAA